MMRKGKGKGNKGKGHKKQLVHAATERGPVGVQDLPTAAATIKLARAEARANRLQQRVLDLMEEVIDDEVDGINICWMRGLPVIGYEQPVVDAF